MTHKLLFVTSDVAGDGACHLFQESVDDLIAVVEGFLGEIEQRHQCLINGREVAGHLLITIAHVELSCELVRLDIMQTLFVFLSDTALVDAETRHIHRTRAAHCLPYFAEIVDVVCQHNTLREEGFSEAVLENQLKRDVLANDIAIVDEKEHLVPSMLPVGLGKKLIELLVKLHVII